MWLRKKEVCNMLGISIPTLERLMKQKKIVYYKSGTSRTCGVKFLKEDVENYLKNCKNR